MSSSVKFSPSQHVFATCRHLQIELIPTTGSHFLLPMGSPSPPKPLRRQRSRKYNRQLSVSPDGSQVLVITGVEDRETKLCINQNGVTKTMVDVVPVPNTNDDTPETVWKLMAPKIMRALRAVCISTEPSLPEMDALGSYWQAPVWLGYSGTSSRFCFATPRKRTLVFVTFQKWRRTIMKANVVAYSLDSERIIARAELGQASLDQNVKLFKTCAEIGWINMDALTGTLTMYNLVGISGNWTFGDAPSHVNDPDPTDKVESISVPDIKDQKPRRILTHSVVPVPSESLPELHCSLQTTYSTHSSPLEYPVLVSDDGQWILNHLGQHILWVPYRIQAEPPFRLKWRWCRERLFVVSDVGSTDPLIVDFAGVDVKVPTALQVFETGGWSRVVISDLARLEEGLDDTVNEDEGKNEESPKIAHHFGEIALNYASKILRFVNTIMQ
ncbi:hypothetical protein H0H92_006404 [Tricholoma furcatifolium]|nr:hypothetical protein H0H92_006404 [Tricholoma furcatifolium]